MSDGEGALLPTLAHKVYKWESIIVEDNKLKLRGTVCTINQCDFPGLCIQVLRNSE